MPINPYLWKASLETINFMPLSSADPFAGLIITDWYSQNDTNERCKINIFIRGVELKTSNLKVNSFCQTLSDTNNWVSNETDIKVNSQIENAILNKKYDDLPLGSLISGLGFGNSSTTLGHALSYVFSNEGIFHGHALAFTTSVAHKFNKSQFYERFTKIVKKLNFSTINLKQNLDDAAD